MARPSPQRARRGRRRQPEHGWALILQAFAEPDAAAREVLLRDAIAIGRRLGDPDVEFEALVCLGGVFLMTDRVEEGLVLIDEALAAACAGELTEIATVDSIFCLFFWACELVNDVPRADQWMRGRRSSCSGSNVAAAFCRAHYGGILTAAGRWDEAEAQLVESTRLSTAACRAAAALIRLADLRLRQGRLEEAAQLLDGLDTHPDAVRTAGRAAPGPRRHRRWPGTCSSGAPPGPDDAVPRVGETTMIGPLLALLVDVHLAEGDSTPPTGPPSAWAGSPRRSAARTSRRLPRWPGDGSASPAGRATPAAACTRRWRASRRHSCRWSWP